MSRAWRRGIVALAGLGVATLLAGCEITGTVDVRSETEVVADLTITHAEADCLGLEDFQGLVIKGTPDASGNQICRARGTLDLAAFEDIGVKVSRVGEYLVLDLEVPQQLGYAPLDLKVSFPGQVVEQGGGRAFGNQVTLTAGTGLTTSGRTRVVALAHPGPEWWVVGLAAGLVSGIALTMAWLWLRRRRGRQPAAGQAAVPSLPDGGAQPVGTSSPIPERPAAEVTNPNPARDPAYDASFAPPPGHQAAPLEPDPTSLPATVTLPQPATEHLVWAPPEEQREMPSDEHLIWAPPEEHREVPPAGKAGSGDR